MVLVQDEPEDGGLGDGVASGRGFYSRSFQEEWNFVLLMGKDFDQNGCYIEFMDGHREPGTVCLLMLRGGTGNLYRRVDLADRHQVDGRWDAGVSVYTRQLRACSGQSCAKSFRISTCDDLISNPRSTPPSSRANTTLTLCTINTMTRLQWKPLFRISLPLAGSCNSSTYW